MIVFIIKLFTFGAV